MEFLKKAFLGHINSRSAGKVKGLGQLLSSGHQGQFLCCLPTQLNVNPQTIDTEFEDVLNKDAFLGTIISRSVGKVKRFRSKVIFRSPRSISVKSTNTAESTPANKRNGI